jgi:hypothetical protein
MPYCLRAVKLTSDIDLKQILHVKHYEQIKKTYNLDNLNSLLILVHFESAQYILLK